MPQAKHSIHRTFINEVFILITRSAQTIYIQYTPTEVKKKVHYASSTENSQYKKILPFKYIIYIY